MVITFRNNMLVLMNHKENSKSSINFTEEEDKITLKSACLTIGI